MAGRDRLGILPHTSQFSSPRTTWPKCEPAGLQQKKKVQRARAEPLSGTHLRAKGSPTEQHATKGLFFLKPSLHLKETSEGQIIPETHIYALQSLDTGRNTPSDLADNWRTEKKQGHRESSSTQKAPKT